MIERNPAKQCQRKNCNAKRNLNKELEATGKKK